MDGGGAGTGYVGTGAAVARDLLRLSGAAESGGLPWLRESVVLTEIECSQSVVKGSLGATMSLCFYARLTRMPGGVCLDLL